MDLNGKVAVRATASDQPDQVTELVLSRSGYTGSPVCICTNRALLERALRLGFTRDRLHRRRVAVRLPGRGADLRRPAAERRLAARAGRRGDPHRVGRGRPAARAASRPRTETTRRTTTVRESSNGHEPAPPAESRDRASARPAETVGTAGTEQPGTSLAALIQEAESLHATLADAKSRTARLIAGLRRHRKQSRLVNETLRSLRQLRLVEAAG